MLQDGQVGLTSSKEGCRLSGNRGMEERQTKVSFGLGQGRLGDDLGVEIG
jgi:hypothetical protein